MVISGGEVGKPRLRMGITWWLGSEGRREEWHVRVKEMLNLPPTPCPT